MPEVQLARGSTYVRGLSEGIRRILRPLGIRVLDRPHTWKWKVMANAKDKRDELEKQGVVYSMTCNDCDQVYVGETARNAKVRAKERRAAKWSPGAFSCS